MSCVHAPCCSQKLLLYNNLYSPTDTVFLLPHAYHKCCVRLCLMALFLANHDNMGVHCCKDCCQCENTPTNCCTPNEAISRCTSAINACYEHMHICLTALFLADHDCMGVYCMQCVVVIIVRIYRSSKHNELNLHLLKITRINTKK